MDVEAKIQLMQLVLRQKGLSPLSDKHCNIARKILDPGKRKTYEAIATELDLPATTVLPAIGVMFRRLSEAFEENITRKNFATILEATYPEYAEDIEAAIAQSGGIQPDLHRSLLLEKLPVLPKWLGRAAELEELDGLIQTHGLTLITGEPGIGKTSLVAEALDEQAAERENVVWQTIGMSGDLDFNKLWSHLMSPVPCPENPVAAVEELWSLLNQRTIMVVIDRAELLLKPQSYALMLHPYRAGYEVYGQLIKKFAYEASRSRLIVISQQPLNDVDRLAHSGRDVGLMSLGGFCDEDAKALFYEAGIKRSWKKVYQAYRGYPNLLVNAIKVINTIYGGDVQRFIQNTLYISEIDRSNYRAEIDRLSEAEIEVLRAVALRNLTRPDLAQEMLENGYDLEVLMGALERLNSMSLLENQRGEQLAVNPFVKRVMRDLN